MNNLVSNGLDHLSNASLIQAFINTDGAQMLCLGEIPSPEDKVVVRIPTYSNVELGTILTVFFEGVDHEGNHVEVKYGGYSINNLNINFSYFDVLVPKAMFKSLGIDYEYYYSSLELSGNSNESDRQKVQVHWNYDDADILPAPAMPQATRLNNGSYEIVFDTISSDVFIVKIKIYPHLQFGDVVRVNFIQHCTNVCILPIDHMVSYKDIEDSIIVVNVEKKYFNTFGVDYLLSYIVVRQVEPSVFIQQLSSKFLVRINLNQPSDHSWVDVKDVRILTSDGEDVCIYSNGMELAEILIFFTPCNGNGQPIFLLPDDIDKHPEKIKVSNFYSGDIISLTDTPERRRPYEGEEIWAYCINPNTYVKRDQSILCFDENLKPCELCVKRYMLCNSRNKVVPSLAVGAVIVPSINSISSDTFVTIKALVPTI